MKKNMIFAFSLLAAAVSFGSSSSVESENTFGILKITATEPETIIGVPWVGVGGGNVKVSNVVLTSNLKSGDYLYYYNGSNFQTWYLTADAGDWTEIQTVVKGNSTADGVKANTIELPRGKALILKMKDGTGEDSFANRSDKNIYIYGQYDALDNTDTTDVTVPTSAGSVVWSLIAPPSATDFDLNTATIGDVKPTDTDVIITNMAASSWIYYNSAYNNNAGGWGTYSRSKNGAGISVKTFNYGAEIKAGTGAWLKASGAHTGSTMTFTWGSAQ